MFKPLHDDARRELAVVATLLRNKELHHEGMFQIVSFLRNRRTSFDYLFEIEAEDTALNRGRFLVMVDPTIEQNAYYQAARFLRAHDWLDCRCVQAAEYGREAASDPRLAAMQQRTSLMGCALLRLGPHETLRSVTSDEASAGHHAPDLGDACNLPLGKPERA